jgi:hypothetical protein
MMRKELFGCFGVNFYLPLRNGVKKVVDNHHKGGTSSVSWKEAPFAPNDKCFFKVINP